MLSDPSWEDKENNKPTENIWNLSNETLNIKTVLEKCTYMCNKGPTTSCVMVLPPRHSMDILRWCLRYAPTCATMGRTPDCVNTHLTRHHLETASRLPLGPTDDRQPDPRALNAPARAHKLSLL